ncbi:hypothetical protein RHGRI_007107 [Rhododendron griersonianum]|uniref:Uncharacterized protein n=1 Tax=Rhododendron griersonianum TaxID=479676 RepID=A0AAV6KWB4_9ERIC|nr:hypothetical protein RHGRI_007107 [Rhododendron griersonianum]
MDDYHIRLGVKKVRFARNLKTGENVAIKILDKEKILKHKMIGQVKMVGWLIEQNDLIHTVLKEGKMHIIEVHSVYLFILLLESMCKALSVAVNCQEELDNLTMA